MAKKKIKGPTTMCWFYATGRGKAKINWAQVGMTVFIPDPITNPLSIIVSPTGCNNPVVTAWLTDADGDNIPGTVSPPPPPFTVNFPALPAGEYILTVQVQCGSQFVSQIMEIDLP